MDSKLKCVVAEGTNIVKIFPVPKSIPIARVPRRERKIVDGGILAGRWSKNEQLAFIESNLSQ